MAGVPGRRPGGPAVRFPTGWAGQPACLRGHGRRTVRVIDDQIQSPADLSAPDALRRRVLDPLSVELAFCPECRAGAPATRGRRWFPAAEARVRELAGRLALVCLDLMFDGDDDPRDGSGIAFVARLRELDPALAVVVLTQAEDERMLRERLSDAGDERAFLSKSSGDRVGDLCRALCLHGPVADPLFTAYSRPLRAGLGIAAGRLTARV